MSTLLAITSKPWPVPQKLSEEDMLVKRTEQLANGFLDHVSRLGAAIIKAVADQHYTVLNFLLSQNRAISKEHLGQAVEVAVAKGGFGVVSTLLSQNREIDVDCFGAAVESAATKGDVDVLLLLLRQDTKISPYYLQRAVEAVAKQDLCIALRRLLSDGRKINQQGLDRAVLIAVKGGFIDSLKLLLEHGSITAGTKTLAIKQACERNLKEMQEMLENANEIPDQHDFSAHWQSSHRISNNSEWYLDRNGKWQQRSPYQFKALLPLTT